MFLLNYYVVWGQLCLYPMPIIIFICCCVCPYELVLKLNVLACKMLRCYLNMDNIKHGIGIELEVGFEAIENSYDEIWKANDDLYSTQDELSRNQKWMFSMLEDILTYMKYGATIHGFASNQEEEYVKF